MTTTPEKIHVGRLVRFSAGYGGTDGTGAIVAVRGTVNMQPAQNVGILRVIRADDCEVDVILFDGRMLRGIEQCGIDAPGIGIKLLDDVLDDVSHLPALVAGYEAALQALMQTAEHPLVELPGLNDRTFLAWNDDSGNGYDAALQYTIPADGDYILGVSGALSSAGRITSGSYRLVVGLDAPEVLQGTAVPNGALIAEQDNTLLVSDGRVQEYRGQIESGQELLTVKLHDFDAGETLFLFAEATSGDLTPVLVLRDFGGKPVGVSNLQGEAQQAKLEYTFPEKAEFYSLDIYAAPEGAAPAGGEFRLLAGVDAPRVLSGAAEANDQSVLRLPIEVLTGLKLQQIVNIDQSSEIMTAVGTIKLQWKDPRLAFSPDSCNCQVKEYSESRFNQFLEDTGGDWPDFTFFNQQGNRWTQNRVVEVLPDGSVTVYISRFVSGAETVLVTQSALVTGYTPGEALKVRLRVTGVGTTALSAKVWRASATEPAAWQLQASDVTAALQGVGSVGLQHFLSGSATLVPVVLSVDDFVVRVPR